MCLNFYLTLQLKSEQNTQITQNNTTQKGP